MNGNKLNLKALNLILDYLVWEYSNALIKRYYYLEVKCFRNKERDKTKYINLILNKKRLKKLKIKYQMRVNSHKYVSK
jgi:hypothetical protein